MLVLCSIPLWKGSGTDEDPHRIVEWAKFWRCPKRECTYARTAKMRAERFAEHCPEPDYSVPVPSSRASENLPGAKPATVRKARKDRGDKRAAVQRSMFDVRDS